MLVGTLLEGYGRRVERGAKRAYKEQSGVDRGGREWKERCCREEGVEKKGTNP